MKIPEDVINRFINEENVKFNQERDDWMIEAMEEYAKLYHESEVKKLSLADVISSESNITVCDNCGNDNVDDGKHKYNMERCRCCEHYL